MPDPSTTLVFAAAALVLLLVPGPAVLYIVARSVERGRWPGLVSALGVEVGNSVHVLAAAAGLSALLLSSALAFSIVKYLGALFIGLAICTDGAYALLASAFRDLLRTSTAALRAQRYVAGTVYVGLGLTAALAGGERSR